MMSDKKWFALLRLTCYGWSLLLLGILHHYEPAMAGLIDTCYKVLLVVVGAWLGRWGGQFRRHRKSK